MAGAGAAYDDDLLLDMAKKKNENFKITTSLYMRMDGTGPVQSDCCATTQRKLLSVKHA